MYFNAKKYGISMSYAWVRYTYNLKSTILSHIRQKTSSIRKCVIWNVDFDSGNWSCNQIINCVVVRFLFNVYTIFSSLKLSTFEVLNYYDIKRYILIQHSSKFKLRYNIKFHDHELMPFRPNWIWKLTMGLKFESISRLNVNKQYAQKSL